MRQLLTPEILLHVHDKEHAVEVWTALADMFASQARARITNLRIALGNTKKRELTIEAFFSKMKKFRDELTAAGSPLSDAEMVSFLIAGLGQDYDSVVAAVNALPKAFAVTVSDLYQQCVQYDECQEMLKNSGDGGLSSSANAAYRGQTRNRGRNYRGRASYRGRGDRGDQRRDDHDRGRDDRGNRGGRTAPAGGRGRGRGRARTTPWVDTTCQICNKEGHAARDCWWRFEDNDDDYDDKEAHGASYGVDTNWYPDTGATHHIIGELEKMTVHDQYRGKDRVHTTDGSGMVISHVGHTIVRNPVKNLHLRNILHVPSASKNLLSVHCLTKDNNVFLEFHPFHFLIKDRVTRRTLHRGRCTGGLYPLISTTSPTQKQAFFASTPSQARWHSRLGHPSSVIVRKILSQNKISYVKDLHPESICDSCQLAKSHQLHILSLQVFPLIHCN